MHTQDTDFKTMSEQIVEKQTSKDFDENLRNKHGACTPVNQKHSKKLMP